jgi:predicted transcriptional regulator
MTRKPEFREHALSRRERQIMGIVYRLGRGSVADIVANLPDPPTHDAVRRLAHILEEKGFLRHEQDGPRNVYLPVVKPQQAQRSVLGSVVETFFGGSSHRLMAALLDLKRDELTDEDLDRLARMIDEAPRRRSRP